MNLRDASAYLDKNGFYGVRVAGATETIYKHNGVITVHVRGTSERVVTPEEFELQFSGESFEPISVIESVVA